eukprot:scaffold2365_cov77-Skeletonema_dohrnii-CCMP3373.AAC.5
MSRQSCHAREKRKGDTYVSVWRQREWLSKLNLLTDVATKLSCSRKEKGRRHLCVRVAPAGVTVSRDGVRSSPYFFFITIVPHPCKHDATNMKVIQYALAVLLAASSSAKPDTLRGTSKADKVGGLNINDSDGISGGSGDDASLPSCSVCGDDTHREAVSVDYLIIGAGPGGMSTSADLSKAIKEIGSNQTVAVIEKSDYIGGRYFDVDLKTPEGYDGKLKNGHGALRVNPSTLPHLRRQMNEYGIQVYCSIFNNRLTARGRSASCDLQNECHIFGDFCSDKPIFVDKTNTEQMPFGAAFPLDEEILERTGGDPEAAAYLYILGYETINPATGNECDNSAESPSDQCPEEACKAATSWRSFLQSQLTHEYAELVEAMYCK